MPVTREQAELAKEKARALIEADPVLRNANPSYGIAFVGDGFGVKINFQKSVAWDNILPPSLDGVLLQIQVVGKIGKFE
jgi:hypothetical protein